MAPSSNRIDLISYFLFIQQAYANGRMVYYDLFGFVFIAYSTQTGQLLNIIIAIVSVTISILVLHIKGISRRCVRREIVYGFLAAIAAFVVSAAFCYGLAYVLDLTGRAMSWYTRTYFAILLYTFPVIAFAGATFVHFGRKRDVPISTALLVQSWLSGINILWAILCVGVSVAGYRSAYVVMVPVLVSAITNSLIGIFRLQNTIRKWLYVHLIGQALVVMWASHFYHAVLGVFVPIAGRSGGQSNPDIAIAIISVFFTFFMGSYLVCMSLTLFQLNQTKI